MAPLCADPRQIVIALNPARRQALLKLVDEVSSYMTSQLDTPTDEAGSVTPSTLGEESTASPSSTPGVDDEGKPTNKALDADAQKHEQKQATKLSRQAERIKKAALKHMAEWKKEFMPKLAEIVRVKDDDKIQASRRERLEAMEKKKLDTPEEGENLISFGDVIIEKSEDLASLQALYHPIPTRLTTIPSEDRREAISCVLLLLLSTGKYSAHSRTLALYLASALEVPQSFIMKEETEIAKSLLESSTAKEEDKEAMSAEAEAVKRRQDNKFNRFWKVGLASVAGAAVIGVTGGLAAPLVAGALGGIMGGVGLGGVASFLGIFWMNGALVGALFGAYGAKMTGEMMDQYAKEVEDFRFIPLNEEWGKEYKADDPKAQQARRLRVTIGVNGWLNAEDDVTKPWRIFSDDTEVFALRYEMKTLLELGSALRDLVESFAWKTLKREIIKRTVLATLFAALWPLQILAAASNVDNPFSRAHNRSRKAGQLLADALINRVQGERPVTLVGYSLGATAIHACLQSLAERHAFGLIDSVVIIGTPAPSDAAQWRTLRMVVSGKIFNVFSENDMLLGFVYRAHSLAMGVAGLQAIEGVEGLENLDLSGSVSGHLRYPTLIGEILRKCGFLGVNAVGEIEKDDFIVLKENGVDEDGDLLNLDAVPAEKQKSDQDSKLTDDLRGITISPPALLNPSEPPKAQPPTPLSEAETPPAAADPTAADIDVLPPLPRRPTEPAADEQPPQLPKRPTGLEEATTPSLQRHPAQDVKESVRPSQARRPLTPASNDSDDEEYKGISMPEPEELPPLKLRKRPADMEETMTPPMLMRPTQDLNDSQGGGSSQVPRSESRASSEARVRMEARKYALVGARSLAAEDSVAGARANLCLINTTLTTPPSQPDMCCAYGDFLYQPSRSLLVARRNGPTGTGDARKGADEATRAGVFVGKLRSNPNREIARAASELVAKWKKLVEQEKNSKLHKAAKMGSPAPASSPAPPPSSAAGPAKKTYQGDPEKRKFDTDGVDNKRTDSNVRNSCIGLIYNGLAYRSTLPETDVIVKAVAVEVAAFRHFEGEGPEYKKKIRSLFSNLKSKSNRELGRRVMSGDISPEKFVAMTDDDLKSEDLKKKEMELEKENMMKAQVPMGEKSISDSLECGRCKQKKVSYTQAQTRAADEPMTTFCECMACGNRWKVSVPPFRTKIETLTATVFVRFGGEFLQQNCSSDRVVSARSTVTAAHSSRPGKKSLETFVTRRNVMSDNE
ncbi:hypothetical protein G7046_g3236 [Stylonectria norvegica]|nr:hypothetical protein G7046_g3236 [Stylonectria norvegica]